MRGNLLLRDFLYDSPVNNDQEDHRYDQIMEANKSKAECNQHTDLNSQKHTLSVTGTIVVSNDRCDSVVQAEYWHEEKALQFEIYAKYSSGCKGKIHQYQIHGISHDRTDGLRKDACLTLEPHKKANSVIEIGEEKE